MESGLTTNKIISELTRSAHGALEEYLPIGRESALQQADFFAHLVAWDRLKGQIRDAHVALPVVGLTVGKQEPEYVSNSLAHLAMLSPRELLKAVKFAKKTGIPGYNRELARMVEGYLRKKEADSGDIVRTLMQHGKSLWALYTRFHVKPSDFVDRVIFKHGAPPNTVFADIANLKNMAPSEAAGTIIERRIPFLIARGALKERIKDPAILLALIQRMSATELQTNIKQLEKLGVKNDSALRGALEKALSKAATSKKTTLKTSVAAEAVEDEGLKAQLKALQEKQINSLSGVDGNWLVLADKSGSMSRAIDLSRQVAATLARFVKGNVHLVFFDTTPRYYDATGKTLEQIVALTKGVTAGGGTSIGCGLLSAIGRQLEIDGIAIVSDAADNTPPYFADQYVAYTAAVGKAIPVYLYHCEGENTDRLQRDMLSKGLDLQVFSLRGKKTDYYSITNLVQTMRTNRYSLSDEVLATPLLALTDVLPQYGKKVLAHA